jgi:uncharacterized protein involved in type VI secretion and phage assembly
MKPLDVFFDMETREAIANRIPGVVVGVVTNNEDPEGRRRVRVKFSWLSEVDESNWARIVVPITRAKGDDYTLPDVGSEVLVAFEQGDIRFPYVLGVLLSSVEQGVEDD